MSTHTIQLHRVLRASPALVYRAFLDADAWVKWLPPHWFTGKVYQLEPKVGGRYRMSFTQLATGHTHAFEGEYLALIPDQYLCYTAVFDDPGLPGHMQTAVTLTPVSCGVSVHIVQEGIPTAIPAEACYLGWQASLQLLALLVEADSPS